MRRQALAWLAVPIVMAVAAVGCVGCSVESAPETSYASVDKPSYQTVAALATSSDLVVHGIVGTLRGSELDDGGLGGADGIPMRFYNVTAVSVLAGDPGDDPLVVGWVDNAAGVYDGVSDLKPGDDVVLFLAHRSDADTPGITSEGSFYVVLSDDNGVLDVEGNSATARSPELTSLEGPPEGRAAKMGTGGDMFTASLGDVETVVAAYS